MEASSATVSGRGLCPGVASCPTARMPELGSAEVTESKAVTVGVYEEMTKSETLELG
jgi:hypothetical protein